MTHADTLTDIVVDVPGVRCRAAALSELTDDQPVRETAKALKADAYALIASLQEWHSRLPADWQFPRIVALSPNQLKLGTTSDYEGPGHLYPKPLAAMVIGRYQAYQIMLRQVITTAIEAEQKCVERDARVDSDGHSDELLEQEHENALLKQRNVVDDIRAMLAMYNIVVSMFMSLGRSLRRGGCSMVSDCFSLQRWSVIALLIRCRVSRKRMLTFLL